MNASVDRAARRGKNADCRGRQSNAETRQPISPVMQKVQALLPANKAALHLNIATDLPLSTCEKLLCGQRRESAETLIALLRSEFGRDVLFALMGEARPAWFAKYRKQLDVNEARRQLAETQRLIEALQQEAS